MTFNNNLPDIPFDAKFLQYPFPADRFVAYQEDTSIEEKSAPIIYTEGKLCLKGIGRNGGVGVDLFDWQHYNSESVQAAIVENDKDEQLLAQDQFKGKSANRRNAKNEDVTWLQNTSYIENDLYKPSTCNAYLPSSQCLC